MMRALLVRVHRWLGLAAAPFLFVAGLTGAVISWDHELDAWLNPAFFHARDPGVLQAPLALATRLEAADPRVRVSYMPLSLGAGESFVAFVEPRVDPATGKAFAVDYNQVALDPVSGEILARRMWGAPTLSRENLLPFLYKLHYSMQIPDAKGMEWGVLLMGAIALGWVIDCLVALWLSFPRLASWRKSFAFRWREGGYRLTFDLHRSGGVWAWLFLLVLAVTSVSMNLERQVTRPLVSFFSTLTPSPLDERQATQPFVPTLSREDAVARAQAEAQRRGIVAPPGGLFLSSLAGIYGVGFFAAGASHGDGGLGNPWLYLDARNGAPAGATIPGEGSAGDVFLQAQFPLHSGRIAGLTGRILVSLSGLVVATLCVTGVVIWYRKRRARLRRAPADDARRHAAQPVRPGPAV